VVRYHVWTMKCSISENDDEDITIWLNDEAASDYILDRIIVMESPDARKSFTYVLVVTKIG